ncbi:MAG: NAD-dependent epimerase/dehydratase family protein [Candidatus Promineifilaceae bacterium]
MTPNYTLVTGATGFIGRALTARLAAEPEAHVAILVREQYREMPLPPPLDSLRDRLVIVYADLRDYQMTRRAVQAVRPDVVFHLAAGGVSDPFMAIDAALEQNLSTALNLLRAAYEEERSPRPDRLIVVRTPGEITAMNPYAASKAAAWQICAMFARTRAWPIFGAMPFQTYGYGQHDTHLVSGALSAALAGQDFPMTAGEQEKDWIYIEDVLDGLLALRQAALEPGTTVQLGTGITTSVAEVVRQIYAQVDGAGKPLFGALPARAGEEAVQVADVAQAEALLGWQARVPLEEGLAKTLARTRARNA